MKHTTLISAENAVKHIGDANWAFIDCGFYLAEPEKGRQDYDQEHIEGAVYAHLNDDLSSPVIPGKTGRHPLPEERSIVELFSEWGIDENVQVVAYDATTGHMAAARLWWLLKWAGYEAVAVLDGGLKHWKELGYPTSKEIKPRPKKRFIPNFHKHWIFTADDVAATMHNPNYILLDGRQADRFRGENENVHPIAGHIPGAISAPYLDNISDEGFFKTPGELRVRFSRLTEDKKPENVVFSCGSGVLATHNILAYIIAGNTMPRFYVGSWSDWITDPKRPIVNESKAK